MSGTVRLVRAVWVAAIGAAVIVTCRGERAGETGPAPGRDTAAVATPDTAGAAGAPVPGWLAFGAVRPGGVPARPWTPAHPSAEVVAFADAWPGAAGTRVLAVAAGFADTVRFAGVSAVPYGCDGVPTPMAAFEATRIPPEGPVWLAPLGSPVEALPLEETPPPTAPGARTWRAGETSVVLSPLGPSGARLTLEVGGAPVWSQSFETYAMGEGEPPPVDLTAIVPGIPVPLGAFRVEGGRIPLVVLWRPGYEGNAFDLLRADQDPPVLVEGEPIYFCAY